MTEHHPLETKITPEMSFFQRWKARRKNFRVKIHDFAARQTVASSLSQLKIETVVQDAVNKKTNELYDDELTRVQKEIDHKVLEFSSRVDTVEFPRIESALQRAETRLEHTITTEIHKRVEAHPIEAIVRNAIDSALDPQIKPLVERAIRDAEARIQQSLSSAMRDTITDIIGPDRMLSMMREAIDSIAAEISPEEARTAIPRRPPEQALSGLSHSAFEDVMAAVRSGKGRDKQGSKVLMVGPAGSGKTMIAQAIAAKMNLPFYFNGPIQSEYKLTGYRDATGRYHYTPFRQAFPQDL